MIDFSFSKEKCKREITDTEGRKVIIPCDIKRAVVLSATAIEAIYICGAIDKVVGINKSMLITNPVYGEIIKQLKNIPIVSQTEQDINLEKLLSLKPDVVIAMGYEQPSGMPKETVERIEKFGIPVVLIDLESLDQNYYLIELIGKIFNNEKKAKEITDYMKKIVREVESKTKNIPQEKKSKVLSVSGEKPTTVGGGYWGSQDIKVLAGGINVADEIKQFFTTVSLEQIVLWNPDVILISHAAKYGPEDIYKNSQLQQINAVKNKRIYKNPYQIGGMFTPRVVLLLAWHASKLYPELNIDWVKIADNFFKKFYRIKYYGPRE